MIPAGESGTVRVELLDARSASMMVDPHDGNPFQNLDRLLELRRQEADEFYDSITSPALDYDERNVLRQALAGMLWNKQYYFFDLLCIA
jgi:hypothetical protein